MIRPIFLSIILSSTGWAQIGAPLLGYVPEHGHIRPVYGIPSAASVATPIEYGQDFGLIAVSPLQNFAIATSARTGSVLMVLPNGSASPIGGTAAGPERIVMSPRGSAAVLWFASNGHLQIISGLPDSPTIREIDATFLSAPVERTSFMHAAPAALAISDDSQWVAGAWPRGLFAFGPNGESMSLSIPERAEALSFYSGRQDVLIATAQHIFSIADVGARQAISILSSGVRLAPAGIAVSSDNRTAVVAARSGSILKLDLAAGSTARFDCGCAPDGVFAMGRTAFRLTGLTGGVFHLFEASSGETLFIPLASAAQGVQP